MCVIAYVTHRRETVFTRMYAHIHTQQENTLGTHRRTHSLFLSLSETHTKILTVVEFSPFHSISLSTHTHVHTCTHTHKSERCCTCLRMRMLNQKARRAGTIRPEDNDVLIERQRMELYPVQSLTDQYLADLDDLADRCVYSCSCKQAL